GGGEVVYSRVAVAIYVFPPRGTASAAIAVKHTYAVAGQNYLISATAYDEDGAYDAGQLTVKSVNVAPSNLQFTATPTAVNEGQTVLVSGSFTDPGTQEARTVTIHWGDGTPDSQVLL